MWNPNALSFSDDVSEQAYTLSDDIVAMELVPAVTGEPRLGPLSKIPEGAEIECCGEGFNERIVKARWRGKFYFVFLQDLECQPKLTAKYACCQI